MWALVKQNTYGFCFFIFFWAWDEQGEEMVWSGGEQGQTGTHEDYLETELTCYHLHSCNAGEAGNLQEKLTHSES